MKRILCAVALIGMAGCAELPNDSKMCNTPVQKWDAAKEWVAKEYPAYNDHLVLPPVASQFEIQFIDNHLGDAKICYGTVMVRDSCQVDITDEVTCEK